MENWKKNCVLILIEIGFFSFTQYAVFVIEVLETVNSDDLIEQIVQTVASTSGQLLAASIMTTLVFLLKDKKALLLACLMSYLALVLPLSLLSGFATSQDLYYFLAISDFMSKFAYYSGIMLCFAYFGYYLERDGMKLYIPVFHLALYIPQLLSIIALIPITYWLSKNEALYICAALASVMIALNAVPIYWLEPIKNQFIGSDLVATNYARMKLNYSIKDVCSLCFLSSFYDLLYNNVLWDEFSFYDAQAQLFMIGYIMGCCTGCGILIKWYNPDVVNRILISQIVALAISLGVFVATQVFQFNKPLSIAAIILIGIQQAILDNLIDIMVLDLNLNHMKNMGIKFIVSGLILFTFQASYKLLKSYQNVIIPIQALVSLIGVIWVMHILRKQKDVCVVRKLNRITSIENSFVRL